jgi:hypothetical protein
MMRSGLRHVSSHLAKVWPPRDAVSGTDGRDSTCYAARREVRALLFSDRVRALVDRMDSRLAGMDRHYATSKALDDGAPIDNRGRGRFGGGCRGVQVSNVVTDENQTRWMRRGLSSRRRPRGGRSRHFSVSRRRTSQPFQPRLESSIPAPARRCPREPTPRARRIAPPCASPRLGGGAPVGGALRSAGRSLR